MSGEMSELGASNSTLDLEESESEIELIEFSDSSDKASS